MSDLVIFISMVGAEKTWIRIEPLKVGHCDELTEYRARWKECFENVAILSELDTKSKAYHIVKQKQRFSDDGLHLGRRFQ